MRRVVLFCVILVCPSLSVAQDDPPALELRGGFGFSHYLHGDLAYTAPTWLAAFRFGRGPMAIEGELTSASHEERQVFGAASGQTITIATDTFRSLGLNLLGRWGDRVSGYAGGGPGAFWEQGSYEVQGRDSFTRRSTRGPRLGAQAVAGVDVTVARRVRAFGQFRYEVRSFEDPGGGSVAQGFAGVSIVLR